MNRGRSDRCQKLSVSRLIISFCLLLFVNYTIVALNSLTLVHPLACTADTVGQRNFTASNDSHK